MDQKTPAPKIMLIRAQKVLRKPVKFAYIVDASSPHVIAAVLLNDSIKYVDVNSMTEIQAAQLKVTLDTTEEAPTKKKSLRKKGEPGNYTSTVTRNKLTQEEPILADNEVVTTSVKKAAPKAATKTTTKKTRTKK